MRTNSRVPSERVSAPTASAAAMPSTGAIDGFDQNR